LLPQFVHEFDQVPQAAPNAVNGPCGDDIEFALGGVLRELIELGPLVTSLGPAYAVIDIIGDDLPASLFCDALKVNTLVLYRLPTGANAKIYAYPFSLAHRSSPVTLWHKVWTSHIRKSSVFV
jgi:hypothetical protein